MESRSSQKRPQNVPPSRDFSTTKQNKRFAYGTAWSGWINLQKCRQLHPDPYLGPLKHDHSLTLIFFTEGDLQNRWIKRGDPTVIWPRDWLPKEEGLRDNILVLSVECHVEPKPAVSVPLERILVRDLVMKYVCSHLNALLGSFLGVVASWGSTCDLIMLAVCFAVYVLPYTPGRGILQSCYVLHKMIWIIANLLDSIPELSESPILVQITVFDFTTRSPNISTRVQA